MRHVVASFAILAIVALGSTRAPTAQTPSIAGGWDLKFETMPDRMFDLFLAVNGGKATGVLDNSRLEGRFADGRFHADLVARSGDTWQTSVDATLDADGALIGRETASSVDASGQPISKVIGFVARRPKSGRSDLTGTWRAIFDEPIGKQFKTFGDVLLDLHVQGTGITGTATMGKWPGVCAISDGHVDGHHFSFIASGTIWSTSGYPRIVFDGTFDGDDLTMTFAWGFTGGGSSAGAGSVLEMIGKRKP